MGKCCKNCKHWDRDKARSPSGRIMKNRYAPCSYRPRILPKSFDGGGYGIEYWFEQFKVHMKGFEGEDCPCFESLNKSNPKKTIIPNGWVQFLKDRKENSTSKAK